MRRNFHSLFFAAFIVGCGGGGSNPDAQLADVSVQEAAASLPYCTAKPALASVTDLSGTWVMRLAGSQIVNAPIVGAMRTQSVFHILMTISQNGTALSAAGRYCDRAEIDPPGALVPVVIPDAWAHTEKPVSRTGSFAPGAGGIPVLNLPSLGEPPLVEIAGAVLASTTDSLPTSAADPRVIDEDNDGYPGISVRLNGQSISGSVYSVQKQTTSIQAIVVDVGRLEGILTFGSEQNVIGSNPETIATLYSQSQTNPDYVTCNSSFAMVKVGDAPSHSTVDGGEMDGGTIGGDVDSGSVDAGGISCEWVRANETVLFPR